MLVVLSVTGCSIQDLPNQISIPNPATEEGKIIFDLWQGTWLALWIIGAFVWLLMLGAAVVYRRRHESDIPPQTRYNIPIEVLYTVTPLIVIAVFTLFTWRDEAIVTKVTDDEAVTINVVGYQWNWAFNYIDSDVYEAGAPNDLPTLYLPVGEKVRFVLTSPDVNHSFWIPAFLMKMDLIPSRVNQFEVTPTKVGRFAGKCAELCGTYHSQMLFWVEVVEPEDYEDKMIELAEAGQTGEFVTGRVNDDAQNQGNTTIGGQE
jgi:cytochrome c oxidase subunit 2